MGNRIRSLDDFLLLLKGVKPGQAGQYMALCPGHDDRQRSLSVRQADGKILLKCFAGCNTADILKSLDLEAKDLFLDSRERKLRDREIEATYAYTDAHGRPFEVVRFVGKDFALRRPDGHGGYIWSVKGLVPTLYRQNEVRLAIESGRRVYLVEGEKDADRLWSLGVVATTSPMGAGKWRSRYSKVLRDADLVIIPDSDEPGRKHAEQAAKSCYGIAKRVRLLELPGGAKDVSEWLDHEGTREQLEQLAAACPEYEPPPEAALPEIIVTERHLREVTADALGALYAANDPPRIFRRAGGLARVSLDEKGRPYIEPLGEATLRGCLARSANFVRVTAKGERVPVSPPLDVVRDCLSLGDWDFPPLLAIVEAPVLRPDGTVADRAGYDAATRLYYQPAPKLKVPLIPGRPTASDVEAAAELVLETICDFPFDSEASRANAIATLFTPILRPLIDGPVPLALFDKPQQGTGASLLAEVISIIATGRAAAMMSAPRDDEAWRKAITSLLLRDQAVVTVDNVDGDLWAPSLAAILTATTYQNRVLGRSEMVTLPNRATWIATGNNMRLRGDLPRRCIWVRMDAKMARPWLRDPAGFKHPRLLEWVSANRGAILAAMLTIARAWAVAGMPQPDGLPNLGGYEEYCRVLGGVLAYMGIDAFLGNLDLLYDEADAETGQWEGFLQAWYEALGDKAVTAAELVTRLNQNADLRAALPDAIANMESRNYIRRLGMALAKKRGVRHVNGLFLVKAGEKKRAVMWRVSLQTQDSPRFSFRGESGEFVSNASAPGKRGGSNNNNNVYKDRAEQDSPDSPVASEMGESWAGELPDCPACGRCEWSYTPQGNLLCPCGHEMEEGTCQ